jgi:hypothetical protein
VEFFAAEAGKPPAVVATLEFEEAVLNRESGQVSGEGLVVLVTEEGRIEGRGFLFDQGKSELRLKSAVVIRWPAARVAAAAARVSLAAGGEAGGGRVVKEAELTGGVVVTELGEAKLGMDRLEAEWARYDAADGLVRLASPVEYWRGAERGRLESETVTFSVGELKVPAPDKK